MPSTRKSDGAPPQAERRAERQRDILAAAVRAFSRHGYHDCTVSRVAREAGVADGTIYLYFQSKEDLLVSAFQHVLSEMLAQMDLRLSGEKDPFVKLRLSAELHLGFMEDDPDLARFLQFQLRQPDEAIRRAIAGPLGDYARRIEAIIDEGKAVGAVRTELGTRLLRRIYFGAVDETVSSWLLRSDGAPLREKVGPLLDVLLNGMRARGRAQSENRQQKRR